MQPKRQLLSPCTHPRSSLKLQRCKGRQGLLHCKRYAPGRRRAYTSACAPSHPASTSSPPAMIPPTESSSGNSVVSTLRRDVERRFQARHAHRMAPRPSACPVKCNKKALPMLVFGALHKHAHACDAATAGAFHGAGWWRMLPLGFAVALIVIFALCRPMRLPSATFPAFPARHFKEYELCRQMLAVLSKLRSLLHGPLCYLAVLALCFGEAHVKLLASATLLLLCCGFHLRMKYCRALSSMIAWALSSYAGFAACVVAACVCAILPAFPARQYEDDVVASDTGAQQQQQPRQSDNDAASTAALPGRQRLRRANFNQQDHPSTPFLGYRRLRPANLSDIPLPSPACPPPRSQQSAPSSPPVQPIRRLQRQASDPIAPPPLPPPMAPSPRPSSHPPQQSQHRSPLPPPVRPLKRLRRLVHPLSPPPPAQGKHNAERMLAASATASFAQKAHDAERKRRARSQGQIEMHIFKL